MSSIFLRNSQCYHVSNHINFLLACKKGIYPYLSFLKRDSGAGVFLPILWDFKEHCILKNTSGWLLLHISFLIDVFAILWERFITPTVIDTTVFYQKLPFFRPAVASFDEKRLHGCCLPMKFAMSQNINRLLLYRSDNVMPYII